MHAVAYYHAPAFEISGEMPDGIPLIVEARNAAYDLQTHTAHIDITSPFQIRTKIKSYSGAYITLIYKGHIADVTACPVVHTPRQSIRRDFPNLFKNIVTIHITDISEALAHKIEAAKCLKIDTPTVRSIIKNPLPD